MTITELPPTVDVDLDAWVAGEIDKRCECSYTISGVPIMRCPESATWLGRPKCCPESRPNYICDECKRLAVEGKRGICGRCGDTITAWWWTERIR